MNEHLASISALPVIPTPPTSISRLVGSSQRIDAFAAEQGEAA
ncbi:hypothetical protein [Mesorhizobium sp. CA8]|nr:hypothetical protein [Mesorhizobium sp. CA8]